MSKIVHPYYPIVYVRGYAGTQGEVENTAATPYMGFNLGSTKHRQAYDKGKVHPWVFESPLVRLMKDHGYRDVYEDGRFPPSGSVDSRSIWIFRYYDVTSKDLGLGERLEIEDHARALGDFLREIREAVLAGPGGRADQFRCYLVAHSMGGLVCRCYLQNPEIPDLDGKTGAKAKNRGVDKLFTYATPHGGIEFRKGLGWVEGLRDFLDVNNSANFGEKRMREFLKLKTGLDRRSMGGRFPAERVFSLVGTDSRDYGAAAGLSRRSVGPMSDGLVQIENAVVVGSPRAFVYRSHSGHYGIVNSEEGYQNLQRFLFGNLRAQLLLDEVRTELPKKKNISATYCIETVVSIRGVELEIHRRTVDSESATFRDRDTLQGRATHLHTQFLDRRHIVNARKRAKGSVGFLVRVRIVPEYHVKKKRWPDHHYEGLAIFEDGLLFEITPKPGGKIAVTWQWTSRTDEGPHALDLREEKDPAGLRVGAIPFARPGISGEFVVRVDRWNDEPLAMG
jgi:hypothetical protein